MIYLIIPVWGGLSFPLSSIFLFNAKDVSQKVNFQFNFLDTKRLERFDVEEQENREEGLPDNNWNNPRCRGNLWWSLKNQDKISDLKSPCCCQGRSVCRYSWSNQPASQWRTCRSWSRTWPRTPCCWTSSASSCTPRPTPCGTLSSYPPRQQSGRRRWGERGTWRRSSGPPGGGRSQRGASPACPAGRCSAGPGGGWRENHGPGRWACPDSPSPEGNQHS